MKFHCDTSRLVKYTSCICRPGPGLLGLSLGKKACLAQISTFMAILAALAGVKVNFSPTDCNIMPDSVKIDPKL